MIYIKLTICILFLYTACSSYAEATLDDYYNKIKIFQKTCFNNKIMLIRNVSLLNTNQKDTLHLKDTTWFTMNKYYNILENRERTVILDDKHVITILKDSTQKRIVLDNKLQNQKYPLLYLVLDLNNFKLIRSNDSNSNLEFEKIEKNTPIPLRQNSIRIYMDNEDTLVNRVQYFYNTKEFISANLYLNYSQELCTEVKSEQLLFDASGNILDKFKSYKIEDKRRF